MKIYLASSWRNPLQPVVLELLRSHDHEVYDFRNPAPGDNGFHWSEIDPEWEKWETGAFRVALSHPLAEDGFGKDHAAMEWAECCVLLLPCGRSAHLEAGEFIGQGKPLVIAILGRNDYEPELMYKGATAICIDTSELVAQLAETERVLETGHLRGENIVDIGAYIQTRGGSSAGRIGVGDMSYSVFRDYKKRGFFVVKSLDRYDLLRCPVEGRADEDLTDRERIGIIAAYGRDDYESWHYGGAAIRGAAVRGSTVSAVCSLCREHLAIGRVPPNFTAERDGACPEPVCQKCALGDPSRLLPL